MNPLARLLVVVVCCAGVACGKADPDARSADWEEQFDRAMKASKAGQHDQAIAIGETYLEKHPGSTDGHMMVGDAAHKAGQAASGDNRVARLEQAASHYARVIETSANPTMRGIALSDAIEVYGVRGLKKFDEAGLARMMATEKPGNVNRFNTLVQVQTEAQKYDALVLLC